jgi:hypothetical protein
MPLGMEAVLEQVQISWCTDWCSTLTLNSGENQSPGSCCILSGTGTRAFSLSELVSVTLSNIFKGVDSFGHPGMLVGLKSLELHICKLTRPVQTFLVIHSCGMLSYVSLLSPTQGSLGKWLGGQLSPPSLDFQSCW